MAPGQALGEELARRLGKERCYRVTWPEGCKDANDVLQSEGGSAALRGCIDNAEGFPLRGLFRFSDFEDDISNYYGVLDSSEMKGVSTGWNSVDQHYRVVPGELTVVTGVPNSGKSEWVDALMCNLAAGPIVYSPHSFKAASTRLFPHHPIRDCLIIEYPVHNCPATT